MTQKRCSNNHNQHRLPRACHPLPNKPAPRPLDVGRQDLCYQKRMHRTEIGNPSLTLIFFVSPLLRVRQDGFPWVLHSLFALSFSIHQGDEKANLFFNFWLHPLHGMWYLGSPTRDGTCAPCIGRQSLNHWTDREVPRRQIYYCDNVAKFFKNLLILVR